MLIAFVLILSILSAATALTDWYDMEMVLADLTIFVVSAAVIVVFDRALSTLLLMMIPMLTWLLTTMVKDAWIFIHSQERLMHHDN
jgi:hypothetical protein